MKYLIGFLFIVFSSSAYSQDTINDCRFEGSGFSGKRRPVGNCVENKEVLSCLKNYTENEEIGSTENKLNVCTCSLNESSFYNDIYKAYQFKMNKTPEALKMAQENFMEKKEATKQKFKDLCYPSKLIELPKKCEGTYCMTYYAVYRYTENNSGTDPQCILSQTSSNYLSVSEKFYFPGAINGSGLFLNLMELPLTLFASDYESSPWFVNDEEATDGALNCSGTLSQLAEEKYYDEQEKIEAGEVIDSERMPAQAPAISPSPSFSKPLSPNSNAIRN